MKRREPNLLKLAATYNTICKQLRQMIKDGRAPHGAVAPADIQRDGLFNLDVDDEIWQDIGLEDHGEDVPLWFDAHNLVLGRNSHVCYKRVRRRLYVQYLLLALLLASRFWKGFLTLSRTG